MKSATSNGSKCLTTILTNWPSTTRCIWLSFQLSAATTTRASSTSCGRKCISWFCKNWFRIFRIKTISCLWTFWFRIKSWGEKWSKATATFSCTTSWWAARQRGTRLSRRVCATRFWASWWKWFSRLSRKTKTRFLRSWTWFYEMWLNWQIKRTSGSFSNSWCRSLIWRRKPTFVCISSIISRTGSFTTPGKWWDKYVPANSTSS